MVAVKGHIMYNAAVPWSVAKRTKNLKTISIYTEDISKQNDFVKKRTWSQIWCGSCPSKKRKSQNLNFQIHHNSNR